jgi:hypothetical protein
MSRLFGIIPSSRRWKLALLLGAFVAALAATGFGAYAAASGGDTINACAMKATGQLRLNTNGTCLPSEQAIQWNQTGPPGPPGQTGPPGPPGNTDSTVRHISNFLLDGSSVTTPILSARGEIGKLSLSCAHDASGANGTISFTTSTGAANVIFYSPEVPSSPRLVFTNTQVTFPWAGTPGDNIIFEMMLEALGTPTKPTVTDIHGFVKHFSFEAPPGGGCAFYVHVDTSEINSGETFTP